MCSVTRQKNVNHVVRAERSSCRSVGNGDPWPAVRIQRSARCSAAVSAAAEDIIFTPQGLYSGSSTKKKRFITHGRRSRARSPLRCSRTEPDRPPVVAGAVVTLSPASCRRRRGLGVLRAADERWRACRRVLAGPAEGRLRSRPRASKIHVRRLAHYTLYDIAGLDWSLKSGRRRRARPASPGPQPRE